MRGLKLISFCLVIASAVVGYAGTLDVKIVMDGNEPAQGLDVGLLSPPKEAGHMWDIVRHTGWTTDENGKVHAEDIQPGTYRVSAGSEFGVFREGGRYENYVMPRQVDVIISDDKSAKVDITIQLGATMTGRGVDENGQPFTQIGVIRKDAWFGGRRGKNRVDGGFVIHGVPIAATDMDISPIHAKRYNYTRVVRIPAASLQGGKTFDLGDIKFEPTPENDNVKITLNEFGINSKVHAVTDLVPFQFVGLDQPVIRSVFSRDSKLEVSMLPGKYRLMCWMLRPELEWEVGTIVVEPDKTLDTTMTVPRNPHMDDAPTTKPTTSPD